MWSVELAGCNLIFEDKKTTHIFPIEPITRLYVYNDELIITINDKREDIRSRNDKECQKLNDEVRKCIKDYYKTTKIMI